MGCCFSRDQHSLADSEELDGQITIGKNRPLNQQRLKWKSEMALTEGQLRSKRDEFWETAPAFEGRREIWDALRAATSLAEQGDWELSQAIIDGANISLPEGTLRDCYDELGNRYQVPIYCLFNPVNLVEKESESSVTSGNNGNKEISSEPPPGGKLVTIKIRLSDRQTDMKMDAKTTETVISAKKRLTKLVDTLSPDPNDQRWFYGGRYLSDKTTIENCNVPAGNVIQVILRSQQEETIVVNLLDAPGYPVKDTGNNNQTIEETETLLSEAQNPSTDFVNVSDPPKDESVILIHSAPNNENSDSTKGRRHKGSKDKKASKSHKTSKSKLKNHPEQINEATISTTAENGTTSSGQLPTPTGDTSTTKSSGSDATKSGNVKEGVKKTQSSPAENSKRPGHIKKSKSGGAVSEPTPVE